MGAAVGVKRHRGKWQVDLKSRYVGVYPDEKTARAIFGHGTHLVMLGRPLESVLDELRGRTQTGPLPTLSERIETWLASRTASKQTVAKYRTNLERAGVLYLRRLDLITRDDVTRLVAGLSEKKYAPRTIQATMASLRAVMADAVLAGLVARNPFERPGNMPRIRAIRPPHVLTRAEYDLLVLAAGEHFAPLIAVLPLTGLRISEAAGLEWRDLDLTGEHPTLTISRQFGRGKLKPYTKTDAGRRTVDLPPDAVHWFQMQHGFEDRDPQDPVFSGERGRRLRYDAVSDLFRTISERTGVTVRPHDMRHTFGSWLLRSGADVVYVSARMGHATPAFTLRSYAHELAEHDPATMRNLQHWLSRGQNGDKDVT